MCGILLALSRTADRTAENASRVQRLCESNALRGPDAHGCHTWTSPSGTLHAQLHGWVLHLRGAVLAGQPLTDARSNTLAFNGEVYSSDMAADASDTLAVSRMLAGATTEPQILQSVSQIDGEWALVYHHAASNRVYFGRDYLGRRSLLMHAPRSPSDLFLVSSVGDVSDTAPEPAVVDSPEADGDSQTEQADPFWAEVPATGIFVLDLAAVANETLDWTNTESYLRHIPWTPESDSPLTCPSLLLNTDIPDESKLETVPPPQADGQPPARLPALMPGMAMDSAVQSLWMTLSVAVERRALTIPPPALPDTARLGILFSGGLDCMVLAALAHDALPMDEPIDLLNVGFENPRIASHRARSAASASASASKKHHRDRAGSGGDGDDSASGSGTYDVPDRVTGRLGAGELRALFPGRVWRFIEVDVPYTEAVAQRSRIQRLMAPLSTVMDLRCTGVVTLDDGSQMPYESKARVLFSGLGADEQLGGYGRHRVQYIKSGWQGLVTELQLDVSRIASRNLGRDDRIIASHGKEVRFPFLDGSVTSLLCGLPVHLKVDPRLAKGVGDKLLLRQAAEMLGLSRAAVEPKRAVQFGARTAKMESGRQKGQEAA
ncbi:asparagine synthase-domain-containing protein [Entophlyctis helioformis]|nr:asparagine synthase-domain-containing protein [Entophlyctis helioformis]